MIQEVLFRTYSEGVWDVFFDGRKVGLVSGSTFTTVRDGAVHKMRMYEGFGISVALAWELMAKGVTQVTIRHKLPENKLAVYSGPLSLWIHSNMEWTFRPGDVQKFVPTDKLKKKI